MGFQEHMEEILRSVPERRQTVFFSATYPVTIEALSRKYQQQAVRVEIESEPEEIPSIRQLLLTVEPDDKPKALRAVLLHHPHESALVFANLKTTVAQLDKSLKGAGVSSASLHGDLEQFERDRVLAKFRNGSTRVLVATDVAARGLDVEDLDLVVNYDLPGQPDIYVHRIGRTGRAGKTGLAISLGTPREQPKIKAIQEATGATIERVSLGSLTPPEQPEEAEKPAPTLARDAKMQTLRISGGRKQKMRPGDILGALTGEAGGLQGSQIGKIEIHDNFSYVAIDSSVSEAAKKSLSGGRIKGKKFIVTLEK
jgi:ATP-independent RNA helicase DbpA